VLHLQAGVHFEEVEAFAARVGAADNQLDRARAVIPHRAGQRDALLAHRLAHLGRDEGRRRFLHHLLVAALDAAFALVEVKNVAVLVAEYLDLDVARIEDEFLDEHAVIAEAAEPLALGRLEAFAHVLLSVGQPHALAAATRAGLHHHRIADFRRNPHRVFGILDLADETGDDIHARFFRQLLALDLVPHRRDGVHRRADEGDVLLRERLGKARPLGQEAISRMHRIGPSLLAGGDDLVRDQIAFSRGRRADMHRLVRHGDEGRARIGIGIDRNRGDAHAAGGLDHPASDFAAIGDEDLVEHQ